MNLKVVSYFCAIIFVMMIPHSEPRSRPSLHTQTLKQDDLSKLTPQAAFPARYARQGGRGRDVPVINCYNCNIFVGGFGSGSSPPAFDYPGHGNQDKAPGDFVNERCQMTSSNNNVCIFGSDSGNGGHGCTECCQKYGSRGGHCGGLGSLFTCWCER